MSKRDIRHELKHQRAELVGRRARMRQELSHAGGTLEDLALAQEQDEVLDRSASAADEGIRQIDDALARLRADTYGSCASCGKEIEEPRLRAVPLTTLCAKCAGLPAGKRRK